MNRYLFFFLLFCMVAGRSLGQSGGAGASRTRGRPIQPLGFRTGGAASHITVDAADIRNTIPATMFGSCMEDVNHEIYGGLYAQLIMGESFEEPASGINYNEWTKHGGYWAADHEYNDGSISIIPGRHTRRMVANNDIDVEPDGTAKLIYDQNTDDNATIDAELRFLQARGDGAGVVVRASNVGIGKDALCGYEIRLNRQSGRIQLFKHQNNTQLLAEADIRYVSDGWNQLRVVCKDNNIAVYLNASPQAVLAYTDDKEPIFHGDFGLATLGAPVSFRNIRLTARGVSRQLRLTDSSDQQVSDRWDLIRSRPNDTRFALVQRDAYNGLAAQVIELTHAGGKAGVANRGLNRWGIAVEKGATYTGSCFLHVGPGFEAGSGAGFGSGSGIGPGAGSRSGPGRNRGLGRGRGRGRGRACFLLSLHSKVPMASIPMPDRPLPSRATAGKGILSPSLLRHRIPPRDLRFTLPIPANCTSTRCRCFLRDQTFIRVCPCAPILRARCPPRG